MIYRRHKASNTRTTETTKINQNICDVTETSKLTRRKRFKKHTDGCNDSFLQCKKNKISSDIFEARSDGEISNSSTNLARDHHLLNNNENVRQKIREFPNDAGLSPKKTVTPEIANTHCFIPPIEKLVSTDNKSSATGDCDNIKESNGGVIFDCPHSNPINTRTQSVPPDKLSGTGTSINPVCNPFVEDSGGIEIKESSEARTRNQLPFQLENVDNVSHVIDDEAPPRKITNSTPIENKDDISRTSQ